MNGENPYFIGVDENGGEVRYDVICAFDSEETGKSYLIYTLPIEGAAIQYSIYEIVSGQLMLRELETDTDEEIVRDIIAGLAN